MKKTINLVEYFASKLIAWEILEEEDKDMFLYTYNAKLLSVIVYCVAAYLVQNQFNMIDTGILLIVLISVRKHGGGIHLDTIMSCVLLTILSLVLSAYFVYPMFKEELGITVLFGFLSILILVHYAPTNHSNVNFTLEELKANKLCITKYIQLYILLFIAYLSFSQLSNIFVLVTIAMSISSFSIICGVIQEGR